MSEEQPAHHDLGPSGASRWINCAGSVRLTAGIPDSSTGFSAYGTVAHLIADLCRRQEITAEEYLGGKIPAVVEGEEVDIEVDQGMVDGVNVFLEYVNAIPSDVQFYEQRIRYEELVPQQGGGFGTLDDLRIKGDHATVTDLKFGKGVQEYATENPQLKLYALGFLLEHGWLYGEIKRWTLVIHQPRLDHVDEWDISTEDLLAWGQDVVKPAAVLTEEEDAPIVPGKWCQFCRIKKRCLTRTRSLLNIDTDSAVMDNDMLALILPHIDMYRGFLNDCEALAHSEISKGSKVGDYKLVEGRSNRAWTDVDAAIKSARQSYKLKKAELFVEKFISPPEFERRHGKKHPIMAKFVHKPQGKPVLVQGSDPRQPFEVNAAEEFAGIAEFDPDQTS